ncbi:MAG: Gfo/Idh/MocA family oxidoreductase [Muribaculaceae bacterium]|nr:Gfo/Idh/MocA family oxidoreductase [Muribaculaceae bacterium]
MNMLVTGLGSIARKHIAALHDALPNERHTIYALRSGHGGSSPAPEGVISVTDIADVPMDRMDFALISNPTSAHAATIEMLLPYGLPLMIEKPVFDTPDYPHILEQAERRRILTYVACNLRFLPCLEFVKEYVASRRVNEVNAYCGSWLPGWRPGTDWRKCYSAVPSLGGGVHLDLIHELDYVRWIFGTPQCTRSVLRSRSSLDIEAVDYANYCMIYPGFCASVILNYYRRDYRRTLEIVCDDATVTADLSLDRVTDASGRELFTSGLRIADTYRLQMEYFTQLVRSGATVSSNPISTACSVLETCMNTHEHP